jgi:pyruvate ferredoxin oxidoreductase gamma subunit
MAAGLPHNNAAGDDTMELPKMNTLGFYEIRFESVGGLGANLAGQILTNGLVLGQGFNGAHFSTYGSEKKGSPVKSHIRICAPDREVRTSSPVERPHLLVIYHHCLLKVEGTLSGLFPDSIVIINSPDSLEDVRYRAGVSSGIIAVVDALKIAVESGSRINSALLGAIVRAAGFIERQQVENAITNSLGRKYPATIASNLEAFSKGYERVEIKNLGYDQRFEYKPIERHLRFVHGLGYENAPRGGIITDFGNTIRKDLSASRQGIFPLFHRDRCIDCGLCAQTCPDFAFDWKMGLDRDGRPRLINQGPNLQYCKGCLRCVEICPVRPEKALTSECEKPDFKYTANIQLWGPPEALVSMGRNNDPAKWEKKDGYYWYRVG